MLNFNSKQEARTILYSLEKALDNGGISSARSDARCLLGLAFDRDLPILPHEQLPIINQVVSKRLNKFLSRRLSGEPISRIRGWREFWSLRFFISQATLDPRPDSETLIEAALKWVKSRSLKNPAIRCLDLGTGSGCLLLALLSELPEAIGIGVDLKLDAVKMARENAASLGLAARTQFYQHSFCDDLSDFGEFDVILSNPPYIPSDDLAYLSIDVRHFDPVSALDGGSDGMASWQELLPRLSEVLHNDGAAFVEIGKGQGDAVCQQARSSGLHLIDHYYDISGIKRCLQFGIKL